MALESELVKRLRADATVAGLVGLRIFAGMARAGEPLPRITYQRISGPRLHLLDGLPGIAQPRIQFDCWAARYEDAKSLADAVRISLDDFRGVLGTHTVQGIFMQDERDLSEPPSHAEGLGIFRVSQDYLVWHTE